MNRRIASAAAAAAVLAGLFVTVLPQHAVSAGRVAAATVAAVVGALVLGAVGAVTRREPPGSALDHRPAAGAAPLDPHGLRDARRDLDRPAAPGSLPVAVWQRLGALVPEHAADRLDHRTRRLLADRPAPGNVRDPNAVAATVHRVLDALPSHRSAKDSQR